MVPDRMKYIDYTDPYMIEYASFMLSKYMVTYTTKLLPFSFFSKTSKPSSMAKNTSTSSNIYMDRDE